jgi:predicted transcriptional regulator
MPSFTYKEMVEERDILELREQVEKLITLSINLQAKMTELMIKVTDLIANEKEMITLLKEVSEIEAESLKTSEATGGVVQQVNMQPLIDELKKLSSQNDQMIKSMSEVENYLKKAYTKGLLRSMLTRE